PPSSCSCRGGTAGWCARRTHTTRSGLDQPTPDGVAGELDAVAHPELVEDVLAVALDGLDADEERLRDLLRGVRLGDQLQDLELTRREDVELLLAAAAALDVVANERRDRRRVEVGVAPHGGA